MAAAHSLKQPRRLKPQNWKLLHSNLSLTTSLLKTMLTLHFNSLAGASQVPPWPRDDSYSHSAKIALEFLPHGETVQWRAILEQQHLGGSLDAQQVLQGEPPASLGHRPRQHVYVSCPHLLSLPLITPLWLVENNILKSLLLQENWRCRNDLKLLLPPKADHYCAV